MKNFNGIVVTVSLVFISIINVTAQSFERSAIVISAGTNLGIYNTSFKYKSGSGSDSAKSGSTAAVIYPIACEFGLTNRIGIALQFGYSKFLKAADDKSTANGIDAVLRGNFHIVKREKLDIALGVNYGYSHFKYNANDTYNSIIKANGTDLDFSLCGRIYITKHFGVYLNIDVPAYNLQGVASDAINDSNNITFKLSGVKFGGGIQIKI